MTTAAPFKNQHLSYSRLSRFETCPLSYRLHYIEKQQAEPGLPLRFGKTIHAVLEHLVQEVLDDERTGPLSEERAIELYREAWGAEQLTGMDVFAEGLAILRRFIAEQGIVDHRDVLAIEKEFWLPVGPFEVLGFIDRVDWIDDETVEVIDYKTNHQLFTRDEVDTSLQMSLYHVAAQRLWPWAKRVKLTFWMLRHGVRQETTRTEEQLADALLYVETLGRQTEVATEYPARLNANCSYCDHRKQCPTYAEALKGKREFLCEDLADLEAVARERARGSRPPREGALRAQGGARGRPQGAPEGAGAARPRRRPLPDVRDDEPRLPARADALAARGRDWPPSRRGAREARRHRQEGARRPDQVSGQEARQAARLAAEGGARDPRQQEVLAAPLGEGGGVMLLPPPLHIASAEATPHVPRDVPRTELRAPKTTIAFVDLETTGLDPSLHDIVEIGVVRVDARSLEVLDEYETLVAPERLGDAQLDALAVNGFSAAAWERALTLREALLAVTPLLDGALVAGHNVGFDWSFLEAGFRRTGLALPNVAYHRLDTASLAWPLVVTGELPSMSLDPLAKLLGLQRPHPHRALADARCSLEVARRLVERMRAGGRLVGLQADERQICDALLGRLEQGRRQYGPWRVDDGRDYPNETYAEVLDGLHYVAAELVRRRRLEAARRRRVYVCHPLASDPAGNIERVRAISQLLIDDGVLPIAPHLYLPQLIEEATGREQALALCLELLATCDEVLVFGDIVTEGMERELREAKRLGIPARFVREARA